MENEAMGSVLIRRHLPYSTSHILDAPLAKCERQTKLGRTYYANSIYLRSYTKLEKYAGEARQY